MHKHILQYSISLSNVYSFIFRHLQVVLGQSTSVKTPRGWHINVKTRRSMHYLKRSCVICVNMFMQFIHSFICSFGMCRMRRFLAVLSSFFHSSPLCTFSCHPSPSTILPSSLTSSCHLFLGLPLNLVVPKFVYNTLLGNSIFFHSLYMPKPM